MNVNKGDNNTNNTTRFAQTQVHLPMYDNGHQNGNSGSSANAEPSAATRSHGREISNLSARSPSTASSSSPTPASTAPGSQPQSSRKPYTHSMTNDQNNPSSLNDSTTPTIKNQLHLEQQIKMSQLQQLQQLQNHIFQQQMALISGQPTSMSTILQGSTSSEFIGIGGVGSIGNIGPVGIPIDLNAVAGVGPVRPLQSLHDTQQNLSQSLQQSQDQQQQNNHGEAQNGPHTFSGLHTPAPSGEIRPMDYNAASPPMLNLLGSLNLQYIEPLPNSMIPASSSSTRSSSVSTPSTSFQQLNSQRLGHRHSSSSSVHNHHSHASYPSSPLTFDQNSVTSPTFHPISPVQIPTSHPYQPSSNSYHSTSHPTPHLASQIHSYPSSSTSTPISAPPSASERLAFTIYGSNNHRSGGSVHATPHSHPNNSVHASPNVLGSGIASINGVSGGRGLETVQTLLDLDLDQDISPLTSPWLGATVTASGGTAISTSVSVASGAVIQKRDLSAKKTSISRNKRTASESGDEGGGTNRNSRKRPVLGNGGRMGSLTGSVGLHAATSGLVGGERRETDGKVRDSTHLLARNSTSPANEIASPTTPAVDPPIRGRGGDSGHLSRGPSQPSATQASTTGSSISRRTRTGSRSTDTPFVRPAPLTTNLSSPMTPLSPVLASGGGDPLGKEEGRRSRVGDGGQGQERESPSPVDLNLEAGQGQDGKSGRSMPPPPLARGGMDIDMNPTEPTTPMDDSCGHLQHGMLDMGGMGFDGIMSLHEGVTGMVGIGMGGLDGMGISVDGYGMGGMDMSGIGSMEGIAGMGMEEMDMDMSVNMGGMAGFGGGHEHSHHRREELGIMSMDYERNNDTISTTASTGRSITGSAAATHHQHQSQSHIHPHSDYQRIQPHLSPAQPQHQQQSQTPSHPHSLHIQLQTDHQISNQLGQNQPNQQQSRMPVATPSSMLNLGRLGVGSAGRLGSALSASTSTGANKAPSNGSRTGVLTRAKKATKASKEAGGSSTGAAARRRSLTTSAVASSPGLKPLRPAAAASESTLPSPALTGSVGSSASTSKATSSVSSTAASTGGVSVTATPALSPADAIGVIRQPKRTHRDAEQRRRNSQKQVIDDLRRLLPPIALPSDSNANNNGDSDPTSPAGPTLGISPFFFQPTATLLPGGLPPRGPPKTGGEGPNKNVSKLQVLLCGNEYIKLLKARVERRDEEIWRLRREIKRLRAVRGGRLVDEDDMGRVEDEVDLEKDLDADERHMIAASKGAGSSAAGSSVQGGGMRGGGDDVMDEDEDEDGDDD